MQHACTVLSSGISDWATASQAYSPQQILTARPLPPRTPQQQPPSSAASAPVPNRCFPARRNQSLLLSLRMVHTTILKRVLLPVRPAIAMAGRPRSRDGVVYPGRSLTDVRLVKILMGLYSLTSPAVPCRLSPRMRGLVTVIVGTCPVGLLPRSLIRISFMCGRLLASRVRLGFRSSGLVLSSSEFYLGLQWLNMVF